MKRLFAALLLAAASLAGSPAARADQLLVAGRQLTLEQPIAYSDNKDFLAPLLGALDALGVRVMADDRSATLLTDGGRKITFTTGQRVVTVNGDSERLETPPALVAGELWLPFRATCRLLGAAGRWDEPSRTLLVYPYLLRVKCAATLDAVTVTVESSAPLSSYNASTLVNPERLVVDVLDADLAGKAQDIPAATAPLLRTRISQNQLNPDIVRLVLEVTTTEGYTVEAAGCRLVISLPRPREPVLPPTPATITGAEVSAGTQGTLHLRLLATGALEPLLPLHIEPSGMATFTLPGASLPTEPISVSGSHPLFQGLECTPEVGGVRVSVRFTSTAPWVTYSEGDSLHLVAGKLPLEQLVLVLDPGHGGNQPGAPARGGSTYEKELNLDIAQRLAHLLRAAGAKVVLTRESDRTLLPVTPGDLDTLRADLGARSRLAATSQADLFVSIHCNASDSNANQRGTETYCSPGSVTVARLLQEEMVRALGSQDGGVKPNTKLVVLRTCSVPAVLLETGYLSNAAEAALLLTPEYREQAAQGIFAGLRRYVEEGCLLADRTRRERAVQAPLPTRGRPRRR